MVGRALLVLRTQSLELRFVAVGGDMCMVAAIGPRTLAVEDAVHSSCSTDDNDIDKQHQHSRQNSREYLEQEQEHPLQAQGTLLPLGQVQPLVVLFFRRVRIGELPHVSISESRPSFVPRLLHLPWKQQEGLRPLPVDHGDKFVLQMGAPVVERMDQASVAPRLLGWDSKPLLRKAVLLYSTVEKYQ